MIFTLLYAPWANKTSLPNRDNDVLFIAFMVDMIIVLSLLAYVEGGV